MPIIVGFHFGRNCSTVFQRKSKKSKKSIPCTFYKTHKQITAFFETITEVHKERKHFGKMKKKDFLIECLDLYKFLLQLKDESAFFRQQNNKIIVNLIEKQNKKTSNQIHDNTKVQQHQQQAKSFYPKFLPR